MKESYWGYWIIVLGVFVIVVMMLISNVTTTNTQDYYLIKEVSEAAMVDAVDYGYYRESGELRINREKYIENFLRRFAENVSLNTYDINFYNIYEAPPKASVEVITKSNTYTINSDSASFDIVNRVDSILELDGAVFTDNGRNTGSSNNNNNNDNNDTNPNPETPTNPSGETSGGQTETTPTQPTPTNPSENNGGGGTTTTPSENKPSTGGSSSGSSTGNNNNNKDDSKDKTNDKVTVSDTACSGGIESETLNGFKGVPMANISVYHSIADLAAGKASGTISAGTTFTIIGSRENKYWSIRWNSKKNCGWIKNDYAAINLLDYIPKMEYNITNASASIYKSSGVALPNITGRQLYADKYKDFVPATWSFAQKLKSAANTASKNGDKLVVYDAYRPRGVTNAAKNSLSTLMNSNPTVRNGIMYSTGASGTRYPWGESWFLAQGTSAHNTACAVDITIKGQKMPSEMHELSTRAIKYYSSITTRGKTLDYHIQHYASTMTDAAKRLDKYMTDVGLDDLASEWWHFQDSLCNERIKGVTGGMGAYFWSNV